jgi:hypothetical protein
MTKEEMLDWIRTFHLSNGRAPKRKEITKDAPFSWAAFQRLCPGGIYAACLELGLEPNRVPIRYENIPKQVMEDLIQRGFSMKQIADEKCVSIGVVRTLLKRYKLKTLASINGPNGQNCIVCTTPLNGVQSKYCSRKCHNDSSNKKHQDYVAQQKRAHGRKREFIALKGGCCSICGYNKNMAALEFHHENEKDFSLNVRTLSNRSMKLLLKELEKCTLLCSNCHREHHYPGYVL